VAHFGVSRTDLSEEMTNYRLLTSLIALGGLAASLYVLVWRDPKQRRAELLDRDRRQARLVVSEFHPHGADTNPRVEATNFSDELIADVSVEIKRAQGSGTWVDVLVE
jgi:hypothetical protein